MKKVVVVYPDGMREALPSVDLQKLIDHDGIVKFQRSDGWVYPGIDPVRRYPRSAYRGPERRWT